MKIVEIDIIETNMMDIVKWRFDLFWSESHETFENFRGRKNVSKSQLHFEEMLESLKNNSSFNGKDMMSMHSSCQKWALTAVFSEVYVS